MTETNVEVKLQGDDVDHSLWIQVRVESNVKPLRFATMNIPLDSVGSKREMENAIGVAAASLAEHQCVQFGDDHDPGACASAAVEAFAEVWAAQYDE
jgi:hypothetical protein